MHMVSVTLECVLVPQVHILKAGAEWNLSADQALETPPIWMISELGQDWDQLSLFVTKQGDHMYVVPSAHAQINLPLKWSNLENFTTQNSNSKQTKASSKDSIIYCCLNESHPTKKMFPFNWHLTCSILWKEFFMCAFFLWFWIVF